MKPSDPQGMVLDVHEFKRGMCAICAASRRGNRAHCLALPQPIAD